MSSITIAIAMSIEPLHAFFQGAADKRSFILQIITATKNGTNGACA